MFYFFTSRNSRLFYMMHEDWNRKGEKIEERALQNKAGFYHLYTFNMETGSNFQDFRPQNYFNWKNQIIEENQCVCVCVCVYVCMHVHEWVGDCVCACVCRIIVSLFPTILSLGFACISIVSTDMSWKEFPERINHQVFTAFTKWLFAL